MFLLLKKKYEAYCRLIKIILKINGINKLIKKIFNDL